MLVLVYAAVGTLDQKKSLLVQESSFREVIITQVMLNLHRLFSLLLNIKFGGRLALLL